MEEVPQNQNAKTKNFFKELLKLTLIALFIVVPFRLYIAQPFIVEGASMEPTFETGQYLIVDELTYHFDAPARGSVLIFKYPKDPSKYFIKRVIGLPNEKVVIKNGEVTIINSASPNGFTLNEPYIEFTKKDSGTFTLGPSEYFVMGDNRLGSADSRLWGPVPQANIIGRPVLRFWPFTLLPGNVNEDK
ncbi:signal peptidase I [Candidatus Parcubacteria bacterium]|nr:signal peptidase I [Candidatus Parcubacteria bacterium]